MASLTELLAERKAAADKLALIDAEVFRRFGALAAAMDGTTSPPSQMGALGLLAQQRELPSLGRISPLVPRRSGSLKPHILEILKSSEAPLSRTSLLEALNARGVTVNGKDQMANLSAHLSYMRDEVSRTPDGLFELIRKDERQTPPEGGA